MTTQDVPDWAQQVSPSIPSATTNYNYATIAVSASGETDIVAAVTSKRIIVVALYLVSNAAVNVKFQSSTTPTDLTGLAYLAANGGLVLPFNEAGWFRTIAGEALSINLSAAVAVGGALVYVTP